MLKVQRLHVDYNNKEAYNTNKTCSFDTYIHKIQLNQYTHNVDIIVQTSDNSLHTE